MTKDLTGDIEELYRQINPETDSDETTESQDKSTVLEKMETVIATIPDSSTKTELRKFMTRQRESSSPYLKYSELLEILTKNASALQAILNEIHQVRSFYEKLQETIKKRKKNPFLKKEPKKDPDREF